MQSERSFLILSSDCLCVPCLKPTAPTISNWLCESVARDEDCVLAADGARESPGGTFQMLYTYFLSCCSQVWGVRLGTAWVRCGAGCLDFTEDVQHDDAADVEEADKHHCLRAKLHALWILGEEGQLVALAVRAALALWEWSSLVGGFAARNSTLPCAFFCWCVHVINSWTEDLFVLFKVDGLLYLFSQTINNLITYSFKLYEVQDPSTQPFASLL